MTEADRRKLRAYLDRPLDDLMTELELYDPASRGPSDVWNKLVPALRQRLCVEWDYCRVRQDARLDNRVTLALAVLAELAKPALNLPIQVDHLLLATIVVKLGLDKFCNCP